MHRNAGAFHGGKQRPGETFTPVISFDRGTAGKADEPVRRAELPAVEREELHPIGMQPSHRVAAVSDQEICEPRVSAILGDPRQVIEIFLRRVGAEIGTRALLRTELADQFFDIGEALVHGTHRAIGKARVAAALLFGRAFQHHDLGAALTRREGGG